MSPRLLQGAAAIVGILSLRIVVSPLLSSFGALFRYSLYQENEPRTVCDPENNNN